MGEIKEEDYGLSSGDDDEIMALANIFDANTKKRKASDDNLPPAKRLTTSPQVLALATKALKQNFGMSAFRLKQEQVVERLLGGKSTTVIFPTGGGKSLCFQIPALVFSELDKLE